MCGQGLNKDFLMFVFFISFYLITMYNSDVQKEQLIVSICPMMNISIS